MPNKLYFLYKCRACGNLFTPNFANVRKTVETAITAIMDNSVLPEENYSRLHICSETQTGIADVVGYSRVKVDK